MNSGCCCWSRPRVKVMNTGHERPGTATGRSPGRSPRSTPGSSSADVDQEGIADHLGVEGSAGKDAAPRAQPLDHVADRGDRHQGRRRQGELLRAVGRDDLGAQLLAGALHLAARLALVAVLDLQGADSAARCRCAAPRRRAWRRRFIFHDGVRAISVVMSRLRCQPPQSWVRSCTAVPMRGALAAMPSRRAYSARCGCICAAGTEPRAELPTERRRGNTQADASGHLAHGVGGSIVQR